MSLTSVTARRLATASLVAAAAVGAMALPASAAGPAHRALPTVKITAVQYDAPGVDTRADSSLNKEWVQLTNTTGQAIDLDGWTLSGEDGDTYTFDAYRLAAHATVRVHTGEGVDTRTDLFQDRRRHVWDNYADTAILRNGRARLVDEFTWDVTRAPSGARPDRGDRYEDGGRHRHDGWGHHHGGHRR